MDACACGVAHRRETVTERKRESERDTEREKAEGVLGTKRQEQGRLKP
jgi:hypothetical protein